MNEVLLQKIIEKQEALEIALLKQSHPAKDCESSNALETLMKSLQSELINLSLERGTNTDCITDLSNQIKSFRLNYSGPEQSLIKHIHHFHNTFGSALAYSLFLYCSLMDG